MDNSSLSGTSISDADHNSKDKLITGLSSKLKINDENETNITNDVQKIHIEEYYIEEEEEEEYSDIEEHEYVDEEDFFEDELLAQMGYADSTPKTEDPNKAQARRLLEESILAQWGYLKKEPPKHELIITPTAELNLVSAFKGSREKEGMPVKEECRVSWAPDVYDPPPNLYDPPSKSKGIAGKNRQKGGRKNFGASEDEGVGVKGKKSGGSKRGVEKGKMGGKAKDKKCGDKKQGKKRGGGSATKYSEFGEFS